MSHSSCINLMSETAKHSTRQALLQSAVAVLAHNPGASMSDIVAQARVGRATMYRYFPTRDALVRELALEAIEAIDQVTQQVSLQNLSAQEALRVFLEGVAPLGDRFHFLVSESSLSKDPEVTAAYARQMKELDEFVTILKQDGAIALEIPNAWVTTTIDALIWAAWSAVQAGNIARNDAARLTYRTLLQGLAPASDSRR